MEGFTYHNIFETKGIEYLLIIGFFLLLIPFYLILSKRIKAERFIRKAFRSLSLHSITVPQGLYFSRFHTWAHLETSGSARIGLDDFLAKITGPVAFQPVRMLGDNIRKGELLALLISNGKHLRVCSPVSGQIVEDNPEVLEDSGQLAIDPFGKGWLFKVRPILWKEETNGYYIGEKASEWISQEINRFRNWLTGSVEEPNSLYSGIVLQDGGELIDQPLSELPAEAWKEFQEKFLS